MRPTELVCPIHSVESITDHDPNLLTANHACFGGSNRRGCANTLYSISTPETLYHRAQRWQTSIKVKDLSAIDRFARSIEDLDRDCCPVKCLPSVVTELN